MARKPQDVTDAELDVLTALWDAGPATIRKLTDRLYPAGSVAQYATVQKLLERLESKGYIRRDRSASVHVFAAAAGHHSHALAARPPPAGDATALATADRAVRPGRDGEGSRPISTGIARRGARTPHRGRRFSAIRLGAIDRRAGRADAAAERPA